MEWISVNERLPEDGPVLVYVSENCPSIYIDYYGKMEGGYHGFGHEFLMETKVTHWMPLPEPPKDASDGN